MRSLYNPTDTFHQSPATETPASPVTQLSPNRGFVNGAFVPPPLSHQSPPSTYRSFSRAPSSAPSASFSSPVLQPTLDASQDALRSCSGDGYTPPEDLPKRSQAFEKMEDDDEYLDSVGVKSEASTSSGGSKTSWGSSTRSGKSAKSTAASSAASKAKRDGKGVAKRGKASTTSKRHPCPECEKDFSTSGHLSRHRRIHKDEKKFFCPWPECNSRFNRQDNMTQHYKTHSNAGARPKPSPRRPQPSLHAFPSIPIREGRKNYSEPPSDSYFPYQRGRASSLSQVMGSLFNDPGAPAADEVHPNSSDEYDRFERLQTNFGMEIDDGELADGIRRPSQDETDDSATGFSSLEDWRERTVDPALSSPSSSFTQSTGARNGPRSRAGSSSTKGRSPYASGYDSSGSASRRGSETYESLLDCYDVHSPTGPPLGTGRTGSGSSRRLETLVDRIEELSTSLEGRRNEVRDAPRESLTTQGDFQRLGFFESLPTKSSRLEWAPPLPASSSPWTPFLSDPPPQQPLFYQPQHPYLPANVALSQAPPPQAFNSARAPFARSTDPCYQTYPSPSPSTTYSAPNYPRPPLDAPSLADAVREPSSSSFLTLAPLLFSNERHPRLAAADSASPLFSDERPSSHGTPSRDAEFGEVLSHDGDAAQRSTRPEQWFRRHEQGLGGAFGDETTWDFLRSGGAGER